MWVIGKKKNPPQKLTCYKVNSFSENILFFKLLTVIAGTRKVKKKKVSVRKNVGIWMELLQSQSRNTWTESFCIEAEKWEGKNGKGHVITQSPHGFELKIV